MGRAVTLACRARGRGSKAGAAVPSPTKPPNILSVQYGMMKAKKKAA